MEGSDWSEGWPGYRFLREWWSGLRNWHMWVYLVPTLYWTCTSHFFFILGSIQQICEPSRSMSCLVIKWAKFYCFFLYCTSCTVHLSDTMVHNKGGGRYTVGTAPHHLLSISPLYTPWLVQKGWWCTGGIEPPSSSHLGVSYTRTFSILNEGNSNSDKLEYMKRKRWPDSRGSRFSG